MGQQLARRRPPLGVDLEALVEEVAHQRAHLGRLWLRPLVRLNEVDGLHRRENDSMKATSSTMAPRHQRALLPPPVQWREMRAKYICTRAVVIGLLLGCYTHLLQLSVYTLNRSNLASCDLVQLLFVSRPASRLYLTRFRLSVVAEEAVEVSARILSHDTYHATAVLHLIYFIFINIATITGLAKATSKDQPVHL